MVLSALRFSAFWWNIWALLFLLFRPYGPHSDQARAGGGWVCRLDSHSKLGSTYGAVYKHNLWIHFLFKKGFFCICTSCFFCIGLWTNLCGDFRCRNIYSIDHKTSGHIFREIFLKLFNFLLAGKFFKCIISNKVQGYWFIQYERSWCNYISF